MPQRARIRKNIMVPPRRDGYMPSNWRRPEPGGSCDAPHIPQTTKLGSRIHPSWGELY